MLPFCQEFLWQPFSITNSQCLILPFLPFSTRFSCLCGDLQQLYLESLFGLFWKLVVCISLIESIYFFFALSSVFAVHPPSPPWMIMYLLLCFLWLWCLFLHLSAASAPFLLFPFPCRCVCARVRSPVHMWGSEGSVKSEWHAAGTQQESILPTSYLPLSKTRRQDKRGEEGRLSVSVWGCQSMWTSGVEKLK